MMREILFRGKSKNSGVWINGYLLESTVASVFDTHVAHFIQQKPRYVCDDRYHEIETNTAEQYTGLTDKNGTKIFEGDIVELKRFDNRYIGKIVFNPKTAGFEFQWNTTVGAYGEKATHAANLSVCHEIEVIGNIHDNPELLKGEV